MTKLEPIKLEEEYQTLIEKKQFSIERALYGIKDTIVSDCSFKGIEDGESPLKECSNIVVEKSNFDLRYSLWHLKNSKVVECVFNKDARAPFWYDKDIEILDSSLFPVKVFRESKSLLLQNCTIDSEEPFWKCKDICIVDTNIKGFYAFFECKNVEINHMEFEGKYSFQYNKNLRIKDSTLNTKDAFWHCKNAVIKDSVIKGEYIGWYSKNIKFINCTIESHQPFCYSKNIKLINCKMPNSDLAFENSSAHGNIIGEISSIKNFRKGKLVVGSVKEVIKERAKFKPRGKVIIKEKREA